MVWVGHSVCRWGATSEPQPSSFIDLRRSLQLYPKWEWGGKSCAELKLGRWMRSGLVSVFHKVTGETPPNSSSPGCLSSLMLEEITGHSAKTQVRLWSSLAYMVYVEMSKDVRVPNFRAVSVFLPGIFISFLSHRWLLFSSLQSMCQNVVPNSSWAYMLLTSVKKARGWLAFFFRSQCKMLGKDSK